MVKNILYGVSVGPGDPGHLTLKALNVIKNCPVIASPRTSSGMIALEIIRQVIDLSGKTILPLDYAMKKDEAVRHTAHELAANELRKALTNGQDVAMLCLGDINIYGSFEYIKASLESEFEIQTIAGVTSFCAAATSLGISLTEIDKPLHLIPSSYKLPQENLIGTKIYMKSASHLKALLQSLENKGTLDNAILVQNCGMANERVFYGKGAKNAPSDYFSIVIEKE